MKKTQTIFVLVFCLSFMGVAMPQYALAKQYTQWRDVEPENDEYTAGRKFGRGLSNIALGWTEVFYQPHYLMVHESQKWPAAILGGVARGLYFTILRLGAGIYDTATFAIPFPSDYAPLVKPEYPVPKRSQADHLPY